MGEERKAGLRRAGSGPHELGLLKNMEAETANYFLYLLNDERPKKEKRRRCHFDGEMKATRD